MLIRRPALHNLVVLTSTTAMVGDGRASIVSSLSGLLLKGSPDTRSRNAEANASFVDLVSNPVRPPSIPTRLRLEVLLDRIEKFREQRITLPYARQ